MERGESWIENYLGEHDNGLISRYFPGGNEEYHEKQVRIADVPAEVRTEHFPNASLKCYLYANPSLFNLY
jgi:hypothetical protein